MDLKYTVPEVMVYLHTKYDVYLKSGWGKKYTGNKVSKKAPKLLK